MNRTKGFNRILYIGFTVFGLYYLFVSRNYNDAAITLGIALAFDPFDPQQAWPRRPLYQKLIPVVQVIAVAGLFGYHIARTL